MTKKWFAKTNKNKSKQNQAIGVPLYIMPSLGKNNLKSLQIQKIVSKKTRVTPFDVYPHMLFIR